MGSRPHAFATLRGVHRRGRRRAGRERLRVDHGCPTTTGSERDVRRVSPLDVHRAGPSRRGPRDSDCSRRDPVGQVPWHSDHAVARLGFWRTDLSSPGIRADPGDASTARSRAAPQGPLLPENLASGNALNRDSEGARKPSYTTLIYEARIFRALPMATAYDVPPTLLIERLKERLQKEGKIKPPEWAPFARTGVHTEKAPVQPDWWSRRVAAVLRKVFLHGPVGTSRLAAEFGGRRDDGSAPYHPRRGSRSVAREAMQQLEAMGLLTKTDKKGRSISAQGRKLLDSLAHDILMDLAKTNPELAKYAGGP